MLPTGISAKIEEALKKHTINDYTCKDDNGNKFFWCLEHMNSANLRNMTTQKCTVDVETQLAAGGKKRHQKTGKKRHQKTGKKRHQKTGKNRRR